MSLLNIPKVKSILEERDVHQVSTLLSYVWVLLVFWKISDSKFCTFLVQPTRSKQWLGIVDNDPCPNSQIPKVHTQGFFHLLKFMVPPYVLPKYITVFHTSDKPFLLPLPCFHLSYRLAWLHINAVAHSVLVKLIWLISTLKAESLF